MWCVGEKLGEGKDIWRVMLFSGREESAAVCFLGTVVAGREIFVFPVGNATNGVLPAEGPENAEGKIVNECFNLCVSEDLKGSFQLSRKIFRVWPKGLEICFPESHGFESHESDLIDEEEVSGEVGGEFREPREGEGVENDADFGSDAVAFEVEDALDSFFKGVSLDDMVVIGGVVGIERDAEHEVGVLDRG